MSEQKHTEHIRKETPTNHYEDINNLYNRSQRVLMNVTVYDFKCLL
jgi:hypothetical protein